ncbi:MAG: TRZ/ATZ family hydrolase [Gammaproteobacteria bacterium]|nr:TRZ/ATZ family hydrolase [Gammaproteobacteria bacterium]MDH3416072.1 TRZ/ATZ family hydrolase [Gammaproteobacteria bacterium]
MTIIQRCDTLICPGWCVPIVPDGAVLADHAVVVTDGRIIDVLPASVARSIYQPSVTIDRPGHVLLPGLINTHTHAAMVLLRGLADDLPLESWLKDTVWPAERRWVSAEMVRDGTELAIAEMLTAGITCFADQYFFPEIVAETAIDLHMRAVIGTPVADFPSAWAQDAREYLSKATDLVHDTYSGHPLIKTCFAPHSTYALSDESFVEIRVLADQLDIPVQIHLHETAAEVADAVKNTGKRPLQRLAELGLVNASLLVIHGVHVNTDEIALLADAGVSIAHCPKSNMKLASGFAPLAAYRAAGINVGIGTDGAASNNTLDILDEIRTATLLAKAVAGDASVLMASDALRMATLDAAKAIGIADQVGSIETGKLADLTCIDLDRCNSQPVYDPISQVVYTARADQVSDVWVAGRHQLERGHLKNIDTDSLRLKSNEWQQRINASQLPK